MEKSKKTGDNKNFLAYLKLAKAADLDLTIEYSNYTRRIKSELFDYYEYQNDLSKYLFVIYRQLQKELSLIEPPDLMPHECVYFSEDLKEGFIPDLINIDIKSAYATAYRNCGFISDDLFKKIMSLKKSDRLKVCGMIAGKKNIIHYDGKGKIINVEERTNPLQNFFYAAVNEINDLMNHCKKIIGKSFLYTWVDGIFFTDHDKIKAVQEFINSRGYDSTLNFYFNAEIKTNNKGGTNLLFYKDVIQTPAGEKNIFIKPCILNFPPKNKIENEILFNTVIELLNN